ncbi:MAG: hypothetical protein ABL925_09125, partial [Methylococcales bacterium]
PFFTGIGSRLKTSFFISLLLGIAPLFLFTNLHLAHEYYQVANVIFILYAVAIVLGGVLLPALGHPVALLVLLLIVISNYIALFSGYMALITHVFTKESRDLAIGEILKRELPENGQFVAFGNEWSSTFAYISQRKSFTVPEWFKKYQQVKLNPENFVEKERLGAIVLCSVQSPNISDLILWSSNKRSWKIGETHGCLLATPQKFSVTRGGKQVQCQGSIDHARIEVRDGVKIISFVGWSTFNSKMEAPEDVFVTILSNGQDPLYLETLRVPRPEVNAHFGILSQHDVGFSRIMLANLAPGNYEIGILQSKDGQYQSCQFKKTLPIKN